MTTSPPRTPHDLVALPARFGLAFRDIALFQSALVHRSYLNEHTETGIEDNQRLEFLGDAVLHFLTAEWLYAQLPHEREGVLTRMRAGLVRNEQLAAYAADLGLGQALLMGRGEEDNGGRARERNLSGAFEALLGALYLDQGIEAARQFSQPFLKVAFDGLRREESDKDARSRLQEWSQSAQGLIPVYRAIRMSGPEHAPEFTIEVVLGDEVLGMGTGRSKRLASQAAASAALAEIQRKERGSR